jgi:hypothetical protein
MRVSGQTQDPVITIAYSEMSETYYSYIFVEKNFSKKENIFGCSNGSVNALLLCSIMLLSKIVAKTGGRI